MASRTVTIALIVDSKGVVKGVKTAGGAFVKLDKGIEKVGTQTSKLNTIFKGVAFGLIARQAAEITKKLFDLASGAAETASKFETTFGDMADEVDAFGESFANMAGLTQTEFRDLAAVSGSILRGMGAEMEDVVNDTTRILKLAGDISSFHNISITEAFTAIRSGIIGESEPLRRFGILLDEASTKSKALAETGKENEKQLTQLEKAQARLNLIYERSGVVLGDLERTQDSAANKSRQLTARLREQVEEFAVRLLPTMERVLGRVEDLFSENEEAIGEWGESIADSIGGVAELIIGTVDLAAKLEELRKNTRESSRAWEFLIGLWEKSQFLVDPLAQLDLLNKALGLFNKTTEESTNNVVDTIDELNAFNAALAGNTILVEDNTGALEDNADTTDKIIPKKDKHKTVTQLLNEKIADQTKLLKELKSPRLDELVDLQAQVILLERQITARERLIDLLAQGQTRPAPEAVDVLPPTDRSGVLPGLALTTGIGTDEERKALLEWLDLKIETGERITASNERQAESEKALAKASITAAVQMGAAQANVLKAIIAVVRQQIQAKLAESVANAIGHGSILGPIAGAAAGALMAILFNKLMGDIGGPATQGSGGRGGVVPRASDRAASLGGIRIQNRGLTQGAVGAPAGRVATNNDVGVTIQVIEPDMFTLETAITQAKDIRNQVGNSTG